jgi:hypothetical protein
MLRQCPTYYEYKDYKENYNYSIITHNEPSFLLIDVNSNLDGGVSRDTQIAFGGGDDNGLTALAPSELLGEVNGYCEDVGFYCHVGVTHGGFSL